MGEKKELTIDEIKNGPEVEYRDTLHITTKDELESLLNDSIFEFFPQKKIKELLKRWLLYYYFSNMTGQPICIIQRSHDMVYKPVEAQALLKTLALHKRLKIDSGWKNSSLVYFVSMIIIYINIVFYNHLSLYLVMFPVAFIATIAYGRFNKLGNKDQFNSSFYMFLLVLVTLIAIIAVALFG